MIACDTVEEMTNLAQRFESFFQELGVLDNIPREAHHLDREVVEGPDDSGQIRTVAFVMQVADMRDPDGWLVTQD